MFMKPDPKMSGLDDQHLLSPIWKALIHDTKYNDHQRKAWYSHF